MKKRILRGVIVLMLLGIFGAAGARAESNRKLTLMIYMCGSNLESHYGSASADIREMLEAGLNGREVSVLIMTGGSEMSGESGYFQTESTGIYELGNGRIRRIWQSDGPMNMGEKTTLEALLQYGMENRPAEKYALILWDHGGGPLEGVCWDETHEMDHLSLSEVTDALAEATKDGKLSWIGFDACLMGSLEVAGQMAPYAEYMIASQETEPAFGWNYAFLKDLGADADGAETGRRIVDAFFDGREDTREILTLACIDLGAVQDTIRALDPVFTPIGQRLGKEQFVALSGLRMNTTGFGKADPGVATSGYDLVDLRDLVTRLEETEASDRLLEKLDRTVVYSRSNEEGACGLSLYHPYANKNSYQEKWKDAYEALSFSAGYQQYVASFGGMLTGEAMFRWLDLFARAADRDENGNYVFEMPITSEQAENMVSAQLLILRDTMGNQLENHCVLLASCPAEMGEDGVLRAKWDGKCLYAETKDGSSVGPIPFLQTNDGKENTVIGYYVPEEKYLNDGQTVLFELDPEDQAEYPEIRRTRVWDEVTQSYSSRMAFSEEGYGTLLFYNYHRTIPQPGADQTLPDYQTWEEGEGIHASAIRLPENWRLRYMNRESGEHLYAIFRLVDSQQNVVCSLPAEVPNDFRKILQPVSEVSGGIFHKRFRAEMTCVLDLSEENRGLEMEWTFENLSEEKVSFMVDQLVLNGTRMLDTMVSGIAHAGETNLETKAFDRYDTAWLDRLESISGVLSFNPENGEETKIPFTYLFDGCDLNGLDQPSVFAETEGEGIRMKLISMDRDLICGYNLRLYMENETDADYQDLKQIIVNGIGVGEWNIKTIPAGCSRISSLNIENIAYSSRFLAPDLPEYSLTYLEMNLLQVLGETGMRELALVSEGERHETQQIRFTFEPAMPLGGPVVTQEQNLVIPVVYPPAELPDPQAETMPVLRENNIYRILLRRVVAGNGQLAIVVEAVNQSDLWVKLTAGECKVNGEPVESDLYLSALPPHTRRIQSFLLKGEALESTGTEIREISLSFRDEDREWDDIPCLLTAEDPFRMGGIAWRNGETFAGETVRAADVDQEKELNPIALEPELLIPENAFSYVREFEIDMKPEDREQVKSAKISLLRATDENYFEVLTLQDWKSDRSEKLRFTYPCMIPTVAGNDRIGIWTYFLSIGDRGISATVAIDVDMRTKGMESFELGNLKWELSWEDNRAVITSSKQDSQPYTYQSDLSFASFLTFEVMPEPDENGMLAHLVDMTRRDDFSWYMNRPGTSLYGKPLQLALRPITEEDDVYFLVSVVRKDGSTYSLPLIPYE